MDWASSEWKQGLSSVAIQKVNALEEKVEKLQKERQQLNLQNDCLKIALDKEKRKVDKEKQNVAEIQRELQTLSETCKDIEDRHQKLQNEIQNRDSRIGSLEVLLAQYKIENNKLQQLVNDVKDLRPLREAALAKREQKALANKENNESISSENDINASLKEKISEQEVLIEELKKKVSSIPSNEFSNQGATPFKTPVKKIFSSSVTDSPAFNNKNSVSVWDGFGSTPARGNKDTALRQNADSMGLDNRDEKLVSLQTRLKQLCQELECQRHNFEASKSAMELKFKEKENALRSDLNYQTQVNADLDKELKETKNRFQQDLTQAGKKIDVLTLQLKKAEQAKEYIEKDFKSIESKISSSELLLKAKEEELKDLQKVKNACDVAQQSLQTLKARLPELERKIKSLESENSSYAEKSKALQVQLDGSNNLVQEKDIELTKLRKEWQILTTDSKRSQDQVKLLNEKLLDLQNEFLTLQNQLKETSSNESSLKKQLQDMMKEKNELSSEVLAKTNALQTLQIQAVEQSHKSLSLEKDLENKFLECTELSKRLEDSENAFKDQIKLLNEKLHKVESEYTSLHTQQTESVSKECSLKQQLENLMTEKADFARQVEALTNTSQDLQGCLDQLNQKNMALEEDIKAKSNECIELSKRLEESEFTLKDQLKALEEKLAIAQNEYISLQTQLQNSITSESYFKEKVELLEIEKNDLLAQISNLTNLQPHIDELNLKNQSIESAMETKTKEYAELKDKLEESEMDFKVRLNSLEEKLLASQNECSSLHTQYQESISTLQERVEGLMMEKEDLSSQIEILTEAANGLKSHMDVLHQKNISLEEEIGHKNKEHQELSEKLVNLEKSQQDELKIMHDEMLAAQSEYTLLQTKLQDSVSTEASFTEKIGLLENENNALSEQVTDLKNSVQRLQRDIDEVNKNNNSLKMDVENKVKECTELAEKLLITEGKLEVECEETSKLNDILKEKALIETTLNEKVELLSKDKNELNEKVEEIILENEHKKVTIQELEGKLVVTQSECNNLQKNLADMSERKVTLDGKLELMEKKKTEINDNLIAEINKTRVLESSIQELKKSIASLEKESTAKSSNFDEFSEQIQISKKEYECKILNLEEEISSLKKELLELRNELNLLESRESSLQEKISELEKENSDLLIKIKAESDRSSKLNSCYEELVVKNCALKDDLAQENSRKLEIEQLLTVSKDECQIKFKDIELQLLNSKKDNKELEARCLEYSLHEKHLKEKIAVLEKAEHQLRESLEKANEEIQRFECNSEDITKNTSLLKDELSSKSLQINELVSHLESSKEEFKVKTEQLENQLSGLQKDYSTLQEEHKECFISALTLKEKLQSKEEEIAKLEERLEEEHLRSNNLDANVAKLSQVLSELEKEIKTKSDQLNEANNMLDSLKSQFETKLQDSELLNMNKNKALEDRCLEYSLNEKHLSEKITGLEEVERELRESVDKANQDIKQFELKSEEFAKMTNSLREELSAKASQINELVGMLESSKEEFEAQIKDLGTASSAKVEQFDCLQEKINQLENHNLNLSAELQASNETVDNLKVSCEDLKKKISELEEDVCNKASEIFKLNQHITSLKSGSEAHIKDLNLMLTASQEEITSMQNQMQQNASSETSLYVKLELLEEEKEQLVLQLEMVKTKSQGLETCVEELKEHVKVLEEDVSCKSSEIVDLNKLLTSSEQGIKELTDSLSASNSELSSLQNQLQQSIAIKTALQENLEVLEGEKKQILDTLTFETDKNQNLETENEELRNKISDLELELINKSSEFVNLNQQMVSLEEDLKAKIEGINGPRADLSILQKQLEDFKNIETSLKEKISQLEHDKETLSKNLASEIEKVQISESCVLELKCMVKKLEEELLEKSSKINEINQCCVNYMCVEKELNNSLSIRQSELADAQTKILEINGREKILKEKFELLEKKKRELNENLIAEINKTRCLESLVQTLKKNVSTLAQELNSKQHESLTYQKASNNQEITIAELQKKISALQLELFETEERVVNSSVLNKTLEEKLDLIEKKKKELNENLVAEIGKTRSMDALNLELKRNIASLKQDLSSKSSALEDLSVQLENMKDEYEIKIQDLENKLAEIKTIKFQPILEQENKEHFTPVKQENDSLKLELLDIEEFKQENIVLKAQCASLELQLKDFSQNKILLTQTLSLLEGKQKQLTSSLEAKNTEIFSLENKINLLNEEIKSLQEEIVFERKNYIDSENTNQKLRDEIISLETELVVLNLSYKVCSQEELQIKKNCENSTEEYLLGKHKDNDLSINSKLSHFQELYALLMKKIKEAESEKEIFEITWKIVELKPLVEMVGTELEVLNNQHLLPESDVKRDHSFELLELNELKDTLENKVNTLEEKLAAADTRCAGLEDELIQRTVMDIDSEEKLLWIDEKVKYDESLKEEVHILKSDLEDLNTSFSCLDDEVKNKLIGDQPEKLGTLKEYQKNVWKLQGWTSKARSKIQLLETKLRASLLREELLGIELSSIKTLLCEETSKVNMYESEFGELKIILWHLQDIIANEDSFCSKCANTNHKMVVEGSHSDIDFRNAKIDGDCTSIHTLSTNLIGEVLALEKGLVITLERCQFLLWKSLVKGEILVTVLKKLSLLRRKLKQCQIFKRFILIINQLLNSNVTDLNQQLSKSVFSKRTTYALHKFLYLSFCASNDFILTLSQNVVKHSLALSHHATFIENQLTIHNSSLHLPIIHCSKYLLFIHQITGKLLKKQSKVSRSVSLDLLFSGSCKHSWKKVKQNLLNTDIKHVPHFFNFILSICEILFPCDQQPKHDAKNHSTPLVLGINEYNLSELLVFLLPQINSSQNKTELEKLILASDKLRKSNIVLEQALSTEKAKHQLLNSTIEEIENDLSQTFHERERFRKLALSAGHLLSYLKDQLGNCSSFPTSNVDIESIDESCFCEGCVESTVDVPVSNHERLSPSNCVVWLNRWLDSASLLQAEVITLRDHRNDEQSVKNLESKLTSEKVLELESKNSILLEEVEKYSKLCTQMQEENMSLNEISRGASCEIENLKSELEKQRGKADDYSESIQKKVEFISELKLKNDELSAKINELEAIHGSCDKKIQKLSADVENYLSELSSKEEEVVSLRNVMDELRRDTEKAHLKSDEYEDQIKLLNSSLVKFKEENNIIEELQSKVTSLKKSNESLNLTIEQIEEELQNVCTEKNQLNERVDNLLRENSAMKEIAQKYDSEKEQVIELLSKVKEMENEKEENNSTVTGLKSKVEILEKDIAVLKSVQREQEHVIFDKSKTLKDGEKTVKKLQQAIIELEEKLSLVLGKDGEVETGLDVKLALEEANKEIRELKDSEQKYLNKLSDVESQRDSLISKVNESRAEIEKTLIRVTQLEERENALKVENKELESKLKNDSHLREELIEKEESWIKLKTEYENMLVELNALRSVNDRLIAEKEEVSKKEKQLEIEMVHAKKDVLRVQNLLRKIQDDCSTLSTENENLKTRLASQDSKASKEEEFKNLGKITHWIADFLHMVLGEVKTYVWYPNLSFLESNLENAILCCNQNVDNFDYPENVFIHILKDLRNVFIALSKKQEEQQRLVTKAKLIQNAVIKISQFCDSWGSNFQAETTIFDNALQEECGGLVEEMQNTFDSLTESFEALKNIVWEKEELVKALEAKLKNVSTREVPDSGTKDKEKNKYEWKFNLLKGNLKQLEQKYTEVLNKNKELETMIKRLEKEKNTLDSNSSKGLKKELNNVLFQNAELESRIKCLEKEKEEMETQIETLEEEKKCQNDECEMLYNRYKGAKNIYYALHTRFEEKEEELKECKKQNMSQQETISELQKKLKNRSDISPCKGKENYFSERRPL